MKVEKCKKNDKELLVSYIHEFWQKNHILVKNQDLLKDYILDSLELMKLVSILEKKKIFSLKDYAKKENNFKISAILNFINKK